MILYQEKENRQSEKKEQEKGWVTFSHGWETERRMGLDMSSSREVMKKT